MESLIELANEVEDPVKPWGDFEVLILYGVVGKYLSDFLAEKEIATKVWLKNNNFFLKRGSKEKPLYISDFIENVDVDFLFKRKKYEELEEARSELNPKQELIWRYFVPDKLINFFYATNGEDGEELERAYLDIDRGKNVSAEEARKLTNELLKIIDSSENFLEEIRDYFVFWTGNSFHLYFFFREKKNYSFYKDYLRVTKGNKENTLVEKWIERVNENLGGIKAVGGHERVNDKINIDPSQTPPGKLGRIPLGSLHLKDYKTIDGLSIPLKKEMLSNNNLINELKKYSPLKVINEAKNLSKRLP